MLARFPYLFTNFNTYVQTDVLLNHYFPAKSGGQKEWWKEFTCVLSATLISSSIITIAECPKIIDQCRPPEEACREKASVYGIWKTQGIGRLMQGYEACFLREFLFNTALLLSPAMAEQIRKELVEPNLEDSAVARAVYGQELVISSMGMGLVLGFFTNGPDQMKTNIQYGTFKNMGEHWAWTRVNGGIASLYGKAAIYRAVFIGHCVLTFNFARTAVEDLLDSRGVGLLGSFSRKGKDPEEDFASNSRNVQRDVQYTHTNTAAVMPVSRVATAPTTLTVRVRLETLRAIERKLALKSATGDVLSDVRAEKLRLKAALKQMDGK
jgi:hypothetical protein